MAVSSAVNSVSQDISLIIIATKTYFISYEPSLWLSDIYAICRLGGPCSFSLYGPTVSR